MGLLTFVVGLSVLISFTFACPNPSAIAPLCICNDQYGGVIVICKSIFNPTDLISPIREIATKKIELMGLTISNSSLMYLPSRLFHGMRIEKIRFLSTQLMSLSDSDYAFEGLEDTLTEIRATDAHYIAQWDWQQLKNLKALELIDVNWVVLGSIVEPLPELPKLTHLGIIRAEIDHIADGAFANLHSLRIFSMKENEISEVKRNMFPNPAPQMIIIDLSDNDLSHLPKDFFDGMPNLSDVFLMKNNFVTLTEKPFGVALELLQELRMEDNPFRCDCRIRWLVGRRTPRTFFAECTAPETLKGWQVKYMNLKNLYC